MPNDNQKHQPKDQFNSTAQNIVRVVKLALLVVVLSHCSNRKIDVDETVRDPANDNDSLIQVNPMVPAAVMTLIQQADEQLSNGAVETALLTLNRALSISPNSALVQQHLAETYLANADYQQAMYWSTLVVNQGPDQGSLCERSRRTQALAAELLGQVEIQSRALESIAACSTRQRAKY
jgi:Tfp pilus assembly protein PilF